MVNKLIARLGSGKVTAGADIGADFGHDELVGGKTCMPEAVVNAKSIEDVVATVRFCAAENVPLTVRGAGTGQVGGSVPMKGGVVLSMKGMNNILGCDSEVKTMTVQAGVLLQEVKAEAAANGLYYPPDPGELSATIGGNAATNAGGPSAVKYGSTRDYVQSITAVLGSGTVETFTSKEDIAAIIGSEGTLAIMCELTLKLIEKPGADAILLFPFMDAESALDAARKIVDGGYNPAIVEYMDTDLVEFSGKVTGNPVFPVEMEGERVAGTLMVTIEAEDEDAVMELMEQVAGLAEEGEIEPMDILVGDTPSVKKDFWAAHGAFHTSMESGAKCAAEVNINVPFAAVAEMVEFAKEAGAEHSLTVLLHAHAASGGMHIHAVSDGDKESFLTQFGEFADVVYGKCVELGGDIIGEYGVGYAKMKYLTEDYKGLVGSVKKLIDPKGILNPGKIV